MGERMMITNVLAIVQARMSSTRFPGKVMATVAGKPMLLHQLDRIRSAEGIDKVIVATSIDPSDDVLAELCQQHDIEVFRGDLEDVLKRYHQASQQWPANHIVRITGDCPLIDPAIIDQVITTHLQEKNDYTSNVAPPTFPDGLDVEIFTVKCLNKVFAEARLSSQREHVTVYIHQNPAQFKIGNVSSQTDLSHLRWTVDTRRDFELIELIFESLYPKNPDFRYQDILELIQKQPELAVYNAQYKRNEGLEASLAKERKIQRSAH